MLRKPEDMKDWQKEEIIGVKAPEGLPFDDALEVPEEFIQEEKPKKPKKKAPVKKNPIEKMET